MNSGIARSRPSLWGCAALSLLLAALSALPAGAAGPFPFEDVNNNGRWDPGVDKDISADLKPNEWYTYYETPNSIVIPAGVTFLRSLERFTGFYLKAGRNITVNSNITSSVYAGMVHVYATGGDVVIGPKVILNGRDYVSVYATGDVTVGAGASFVSHGGSANLGTVSVQSQTGSITLGAGVKFTTLREVFISAADGDFTSESKLQVAATQGSLSVDGRRVILNGGILRAADVYIAGDGLPLEFRYNRLSIPKAGSLGIDNPKSTVDITGTPMPRIHSVWINAAHVINGPALFPED